MEHDLKKAQNIKLILEAFEQLSGLKINFHKSKLFCFGEAKDSAALYAELVWLWARPVSYSILGDPIHYRRLIIVGWKLVEERLQKRLNRWKGKLVSL
jgi:hypothetical protein